MPAGFARKSKPKTSAWPRRWRLTSNPCSPRSPRWKSALTSYAREQTRRELLIAADQANAQSVDMARDLYSHGLADFLRVLEAQRARCQTEDELIVSERTVSTDLIALYKALGGGWEIAADQRPSD